MNPHFRYASPRTTGIRRIKLRLERHDEDDADPGNAGRAIRKLRLRSGKTISYFSSGEQAGSPDRNRTCFDGLGGRYPSSRPRDFRVATRGRTGYAWVAARSLNRLGPATWYPRPESNRVAFLRRDRSRSATGDKARAPVRFERILPCRPRTWRRRPIQGRGMVHDTGVEPVQPEARDLQSRSAHHLGRSCK